MADQESTPPEPTIATSEASQPEASQPSAEPEGPSKEEMRLAMKAFRKKLKLMRLDEESKLGYGPTSTGEKSRIGAITPPHAFPKAVWKALARAGKLRQETSTLYSLVE